MHLTDLKWASEQFLSQNIAQRERAFVWCAWDPELQPHVRSRILAPGPPPLILRPEESWIWSRQCSQILASEFPGRLARMWATCSLLRHRFWFLDQRLRSKMTLKLSGQPIWFYCEKAEFSGFISHWAKHFLEVEHFINIKSGGLLLLVAEVIKQPSRNQSLWERFPAL